MNNNIPKTDQIRQKALSGFLWRLLERTGAQGVSVLVTIVLARLLNPELYGLVALAMTFITILNVFVDSGLGSALVQKKEADNKDFATVFSLSFLPASDWLKLLVQIPCGVAIYWLGSRLFHLESYDYLLISLREMIQRKKAGIKLMS